MKNYEILKNALEELDLTVRFQHRRLKDIVTSKTMSIVNDNVPKRALIAAIKMAAKSKHEFERDEKNNPKISARGGFTIANIYDQSNTIVATGEAICTLSDNYSKHHGRVRSLGRAFSNLKKG